LAIGDLNGYMKGYSSTIINAVGLEPDEGIKALHFGHNMSAELVFRFFGRFGIGLGAGYIRLANTSRLTFHQDLEDLSLVNRPEVEAIPIFLNAYFYPFKNVYFKIGINYNIVDFSYSHRLELRDFWMEERGEGSSKDLGFFGALGIEVPFSRRIFLILEGRGAYLKLDGLKGKKIINTSIGHSHEEEGLFYFSKLDNSSSGFLAIDVEDLDETKIREAVVDLSGFSLVIGIKIIF